MSNIIRLAFGLLYVPWALLGIVFGVFVRALASAVGLVYYLAASMAFIVGGIDSVTVEGFKKDFYMKRTRD